MNSAIKTEDIMSMLNRSLSFHFQEKDRSNRQITHFGYRKSWTSCQIIEICCLIFILCEHTFVFILTFEKKPVKRNLKKSNQRSVLLPSKSFLYSCLHRNWIRAFSFSNICFSVVYFVILILKYYHPNLVHYSSITFYSLILNLFEQIIINFSTFHLFIISISVIQYFLRYYRLLKNTYSSYFFNGRNLLLTKHTNVALILSGSLSLIFAYNYIFYAPKSPHTMSLLPLITFNMILLPLINLLIFSFILISFILTFFFKFNVSHISMDNEQENLRWIIEKNTCIKCYTKILDQNLNLFQDKNYSYKNLYNKFFPTHFRSSYPFQIKRTYFSSNKKTSPQTDFSYEQQNDLEKTLFLQTTLIKLNDQHSLCHLCYYLLIIFLFKYILFTFPQYIIQMLFHLKQFYQFIFKYNLSKTLITYSFYENNEKLLTISHLLFLLSRFGDSFLLIRLPYLIKKYFPCWCHFNSKLLRRQQISHQILTTKNSNSSNNEPIPLLDLSNSNELEQQVSIERPRWKTKHHRLRLQFRFIPLWSRHRPRLFTENS